MKSASPIKFLMLVKSNCPIFQWGPDTNLPIFEQISMNISGFFGAFTSLIPLLQNLNLLGEKAKLDVIKIGKTHIIFRDNDLFQSIYVVESVGLRKQKSLVQLLKKIDDKFMQMFEDILNEWDHSIEPFKEFEEVCGKLL